MTVSNLKGCDTALTLQDEVGMETSILSKHIYLERRVCEGTQTYSKISLCNELPYKYQPKSINKSFHMTVVSIPKKMVDIHINNPSPELREKYIHKDTVSFCIHPAIIEDNKKVKLNNFLELQEASLEVIPTSSSRTVLVVDSQTPIHAIKCHCPYRISRFYRNLGPLTIQHSITISRLLEKTGVTYLPESIGICFRKTNEESGWGFIVREMLPRPNKNKQPRLMIPCLALYGRDMYLDDKSPLLVKMIKTLNQNPIDFVLNYIMFPIIEDFLSIFQSQGILLEAHGQNTLLEVDEQLNPIRIVHRDFDNYVDTIYRQQLGLPLDGLKTTRDPAGKIHSLIYDYSIAHHHFEYLAKLLEEYFSVPSKKLRSACIQKFKSVFPDYQQHFPSKVYYYADKPTSFNVYPLIETGEKPNWRPEK